MQVPDIIIAIDGYSSTGKSTLAKLLAKEFSFLYLDSGALYRGVTLFAQERGFISEAGVIDEEALRAALPELDLHFEYTPEGSKTFIGDRCVEVLSPRLLSCAISWMRNCTRPVQRAAW